MRENIFQPLIEALLDGKDINMKVRFDFFGLIFKLKILNLINAILSCEHDLLARICLRKKLAVMGMQGTRLQVIS
jgi:hypothetical protein